MKLPNPILIAFICFFQGCALFAPESRNPVPEKFPSEYSLYSEEERISTDRWWETFDSPELNRLVNTALSDNFTIRETWARLAQAQAGSTKAKAAFWPEVIGNAGVTHSWAGNKDSSGNTTETEDDSFSLGLAAAYELDIWGRIRSIETAENAKMHAGRSDIESTAMLVAAGMAENWIDLIATRKAIQLVEDQVNINLTVLKIQELRFDKSLASALDVLQQMEVVERSKARIPPLEAQEQVLMHSLAVLMGEPPGVDLKISQQTLPSLEPMPESGLSADLLAMRPDVRAAGLRLKAADWEVSAAKANRLPTLTLTGSAMYSGDALETVFDNWAGNLAAGLTGPIFDAGRRKAEVERTKAVVQERLATYEKTVFTALKEVENSMLREKKQRVHIQALKKELQVSKRALDEAKMRYAKGLDPFLPFLLQQYSVQELERELIRQEAMLLNYRISLYRALGGSWTRTLTEEGLSQKKDELSIISDP